MHEKPHLGSTLSPSRNPSVANPRPVVQTSAGRVRGVSNEGAFRFTGLSYGDDTSSAHRFAPPRPCAWTGTRDALAFGPRCPQVVSLSAAAAHVAWISDTSPQAENCLTLNVWTA